MKLSKRTDNAIRVLLYLRNNSYIEENYISGHQISTDLEVSYNNIRKIISALNDLGFTTSRLGQNGGVSLHTNYNQVSLMKAISFFEEYEKDKSKLSCNTCNITSSCNFDNITKLATFNFFKTYKNVFLDDL